MAEKLCNIHNPAQGGGNCPQTMTISSNGGGAALWGWDNMPYTKAKCTQLDHWSGGWNPRFNIFRNSDSYQVYTTSIQLNSEVDFSQYASSDYRFYWDGQGNGEIHIEFS